MRNWIFDQERIIGRGVRWKEGAECIECHELVRANWKEGKREREREKGRKGGERKEEEKCRGGKCQVQIIITQLLSLVFHFIILPFLFFLYCLGRLVSRKV